MAEQIKVKNRRLWMHKGVRNPNFLAEHVLTRDPWLYVELWLKRQKSKDSLSYWTQARRFAEASEAMPVEAAPLAAYYAFLNATKALLTFKKCAKGKHHGVTGDRPENARAMLSNEQVTFQMGGVLPDLCAYFGDSATREVYSLADILWNIPFIHRAFRLTFKAKAELFIPLESACYVRKDGTSESYFSARIIDRFTDRRRLSSIPSSFEVIEDEGGLFVRRKKRFRWFVGRSSAEKIHEAHKRLEHYHSQTRRLVVSISGNKDLWYLKKKVANNNPGSRHVMPLMFAAMHRFSELARYDPNGFERHLSGQANWLITEFLRNSMDQFIDQVATEITGCQFWPPKIRTT